MQTGGAYTVHEYRVEKGHVVPTASKVTGLALFTDMNEMVWAAFLGKGP